eukprot:4269017-Amphidinium_carterae.1
MMVHELDGDLTWGGQFGSFSWALQWVAFYSVRTTRMGSSSQGRTSRRTHSLRRSRCQPRNPPQLDLPRRHQLCLSSQWQNGWALPSFGN